MFKSFIRQITFHAHEASVMHAAQDALSQLLPEVDYGIIPDRNANFDFRVKDETTTRVYGSSLTDRSPMDKWQMMTALQRMKIARLAIESDCTINSLLETIHPEFWGDKYEGLFTGAFNGTYGGLCTDGSIHT